MPDLHQVSDSVLVEQVLAGDRAAYAEIVRRYQAPLYRYVMRLVKTPEEASDQLQESLVKAFRNLGKFDVSRPFGPWLYRIARNTCLDHLRRQAARPVMTEGATTGNDDEDRPSAIDRAEAEGVEADPLAAVSGKQLSQRVQDAVKTLDDKYREVIELYHFEGLTYEEIAEVLRIPLGTVMTRLFRARKKLATQLKPLD
jgi:RNA polymerase sigma-70 factor (ECF subfamily)